MTARPEILEVERIADGVRLELRIPSDLRYLPDHFPRFRMVPGVVQLAWAFAYAAEHLGATAPFRRIAALKFQHPLLPGDRARLRLTRVAGGEVAFAYEKGERACSGGRIVFAAPGAR
jgi:3-hydroxymyristoyl/3-hydroxydecanoyl-(acyl carrier protein) dehydratase